MPKGPTVGKVKSGITLFWEELWEILRDHQPYQRNSRELQNISWAVKLCARQGETGLVIHRRKLVDSEEPCEGNLHARECVQLRLVCSAGVSPARVRIRGPIAWMAVMRETE